MNYSGIYNLVSEEMVWSKDGNLRVQFILPLCTIFTAIMMICVRGNEVGLVEAVVCNILSRQLVNFIALPFLVYYATLNGESDPAYSFFHTYSSSIFKASKIFWFYLLLAFAHLLSSITTIIALAVMVKYLYFS